MKGLVYRNNRSARSTGRPKNLLVRLVLDRAASEPLYRQIAASLQAEIRAGRLSPGTRLPSTRELAGGLGVNLVTAVGAYRELGRLGLARGQVGRGTYVTAPWSRGEPGGITKEAQPFGEAAALVVAPAPATGHADPAASRPSRASVVASPPDPETGGFPTRWSPAGIPQTRATMFLKPLGRDVIPLSSGLPSADFFPMAGFRRAMEAVLHREGNAALQYQPMEGYGPLREAAAHYLGLRGTRVRTEDVLICSGAVTGVHIVARFLTLPGDVVLTENPTYCGCLSALESLGVKLVGVPVDREGTRVDVAERLIRQHRPKAIYTISTYNNPTGVCLSADRRQALLALAQREGITIIEEDYANEIGFTGPSPATLKAMDESGRVIYVKSFAKLVFPSIRLAAIAAPPSMTRGLLNAKEGIDPYSSGLNQRVLHELMVQPGFVRYVDSLPGKYRPRWEAMCTALRELAGRDMTWLEPQGGVHVWVRLPEGLNSQDLLGEAVEAGVAFTPGPCFVPDRGGMEYLRLSFGNARPEQIRTGVTRLMRVVRRHLGRQRRRPVAELATTSMLL